MSDESCGWMSDDWLHSAAQNCLEGSWQRCVAGELLERRKLDALHEAAVRLVERLWALAVAHNPDGRTPVANLYVTLDSREFDRYRYAKAALEQPKPDPDPAAWIDEAVDAWLLNTLDEGARQRQRDALTRHLRAAYKERHP
jgi:hypothetical protein